MNNKHLIIKSEIRMEILNSDLANIHLDFIQYVCLLCTVPLYLIEMKLLFCVTLFHF